MKRLLNFWRLKQDIDYSTGRVTEYYRRRNGDAVIVRTYGWS